MADFDLGSYNTVPERIIEFRAKYPEGSLQRLGDLQVFDLGGTTFITYTAAAFRTPDDPCPGIGTAWEPVPGPTKFTRNSEVQNAETAAWGRAIIAVGAADAKKGIASREDVQSRVAEQEYYASAEYAEQQAVPGLRSTLQAAVDKYKGNPPDPDRVAALADWFKENDLPPIRRMNADQCDRVIDHLMSIEPEAA